MVYLSSDTSVAKMKVIKKESELIWLIMTEDDLFTCDTPLGETFDEFNRLSRMDDDLFTYEHEQNLCYDEEEKSYVEAVIFINTRGDDEEVLTDKELSELEETYINEEIFKIETNIFDYETPLCKAFNEFNYLFKIDTDLLTHDIPEFKTYEEYKNTWIHEWNEEVSWVPEEPWSGNEVPYEIVDHHCVPFCLKSRHVEWPTCHLNDDGYCDRVDLPGMIQNKNMVYFQDYECSKKKNKVVTIKDENEPMDDYDTGNSDDHLVSNNAPYYANQEKEQYKEGRCELFRNPREIPPKCKIKRFEVIKDSFGPAEEFVAIKEYGYNDWMKTEEDAY
nr:hypothetical protein [Tanacetum cinerariifolium]